MYFTFNSTWNLLLCAIRGRPGNLFPMLSNQAFGCYNNSAYSMGHKPANYLATFIETDFNSAISSLFKKNIFRSFRLNKTILSNPPS